MTDLDGLLAAVLAEPDDDLPRLVYADALEESGEGERAAFIRVQCEVALPKWAGHRSRADVERLRTEGAVMGGCCGRHADMLPCGCMEEVDPAYDALARWERHLLELHWHEWSSRVATYCRNYHKEGAFGVAFRRGFVDAVRCPWDAWAAHGDELVAAHPVRRVELTTLPEATDSLQGDPAGMWVEIAGRDVCIPWTAPALTDEAILRARWPSVREWHLSAAHVVEYRIRKGGAA